MQCISAQTHGENIQVGIEFANELLIFVRQVRVVLSRYYQSTIPQLDELRCHEKQVQLESRSLPGFEVGG
jgi:hypothetical protein